MTTREQALSDASRPVENGDASARNVPRSDTYTGSLTILGEPCWLVGEDDYERHYSTREAAQECADLVNSDHLEDDPEWVPWEVHQRTDERCVLVSCAHCGYRFDEDGDGVTHFPESTAALVGDYDWIVDGDTAVCQECSCVAVGHDPSRLGPWCIRCGASTENCQMRPVDGAR